MESEAKDSGTHPRPVWGANAQEALWGKSTSLRISFPQIPITVTCSRTKLGKENKINRHLKVSVAYILTFT